MTQILFQRCDGESAGAAVALPRARRRLSTVVRKHADRTRPYIVSVHRKKHPLAVSEMSVRLRKDWRNTTIGPLDTIIIVYLPRGGAGGAGGSTDKRSKGISAGIVIATIALAVLAPYAAPLIATGLGVSAGVASTIWAVGSAALLAGGAYLLSKATQSKANKEQPDRPVYGVAGGGNQPRAGDRIPVLYGRCWNNPDLSQPDYTVYDGDDQVLFKRLTIGCGKYSIKTVRVSNVVMWTADGGLTPPFAGAEIEVIQPGGTSSLVPGQVASAQAVSGNELPRATDFPAYAGPFDFGSGAPEQTRIQLDYSVPQGVYAVPSGGKFQGKQYPTVWGVKFEYAPCDEDGNPTGAWSTLYQDGAEALTTRASRFTRYVDIPEGRYTYRAQNIGAPLVIPGPGFDADVTNAVVWEGLRAHIPQTAVRPGVTELALRIRSGKSLGVTTYGEIEVESSRILPTWDGSTWIEEETAKSVWAMADILRDQTHGAGLSDSAIDLGRLQYYAEALDEYDTFSGVIRGPVSVYDALTTVLGTMRSSPLRLGSAWTMVRDEAKSVRKHVISRRQIIRDSSGQTFNLDLSDGSADVIVEWDVDGDPRRKREHRVTFGTITNKPRRMAATGATSGEHAIHLATWAAATAYYRRERRSVTTELSGRLLLPNDLAMIDTWYFDAFQSVGVLDRSGLALTIDTDVSLPDSPFAILRARDGREWGPVGVTLAGDTLTLDADDVAQAESLSGLTLSEVLNTSTQAFTTAVIGTLTEVQDVWLIRTVGFSGDTQVNVEAVFDAPEVWSALGESIVPPPPPPSSGLENEASVAISYIKAKAVQRNAAMFMDWTVGRTRAAASYVVNISYDDWDTFEEAHRGAASSGSYPLRETTGIVWVRAYAISDAGLVGQTVSTQFSIAPAFIDLENAIHGSLRIEAFTDGIEPVGLVDGLPDPFGYTGPKLVFDINDEKQYRYTVDGWKPVFDISDIPNGSITETMIEDDSISTPKLQANSISTDKIIAGAVVAASLASDSVTTGKLQAGAVSADKINVTKIDAISADLGDITAGSLNINNRFIVASNGATTIQNATTGQRTVITDALIQVYDSAGTLRVRLGIWP